VEFITLHDDILSKIFISARSGGEQINVSWGLSDSAGSSEEQSDYGSRLLHIIGILLSKVNF
jgi:hypothetical protein|tara:strand:- start:99 stop:284 length:186 start_codon:yes stop_codon:yes gene_type:complete